MKNRRWIVLTLAGVLLAAGCGEDHTKEDAFVPVTGRDLQQLAQRITSLEAHMRETQALLVRAEKERKEERARLQAIEARFPAKAGGEPGVSQPATAATATAHRGNEAAKGVRH